MPDRCVRSLPTIVFAAVIAMAATRPTLLAQDTAAARTAVEAWLVLIDQEQYGQSWTTAAGAFRNAIPQAKWEAAAGGARKPLGALKSRALKSAMSTKTLPGAPDGDYVVLRFDTVFEHKAAAIETVTAVREPDGTWHVGGYYIN